MKTEIPERPERHVTCRAALTGGVPSRLSARVSISRAGGLTLLDYHVIPGADAAAHGVERIVLETEALGAQQAEVFRQGFYMPSDPTGFYLLRAGQPVPEIPQWRPTGWNASDFISHSMAVTVCRGAPVCRLTGFVSFDHFHGYFVFHTRSPQLRRSAVVELEGLRPEAGKRLHVGTLAIAESPDLEEVLDCYTSVLAERYRARGPRRTITGWVDWQYYREEKNARVIEDSTRVLARLRRQGAPLQYVIIDGGWCEHASEWMGRCSKFPSGMRSVCQGIRRHGMKPGLWLAPYLTNVQTKVVRQHPEWLALSKDDGKPVYMPASNVGPCHVIDYSVPQARAWLSDIVRTMVRDWGVAYLKLDGPSLGHYRGARLRDPSMTVVAMIRTSLDIIREAAGSSVCIEGEGLYGPAIGLVDVQRTTQDTHTNWHISMRENLKNDLLSAFLHRRLWHNHREDVILRDFSSPFAPGLSRNPPQPEAIMTDNELRFQLTAATLAGGAMLLTDPMEELRKNPGRMNLLRRFLPHYEGAAARPLDVFRGGRIPALYVLRVERPFACWHLLGIFNWGERYEDFDVPLRDFAGAQPLRVFDVWEERHLGRATRTMTVRNVPPHGCTLLGLRPVSQRPQWLGSNLHLLQGAVDIEHMQADDESLSFTIKHFQQHEARIHLHIPASCTLTTTRSNARHLRCDQRGNMAVLYYDNPKRRTEFSVCWRNKTD